MGSGGSSKSRQSSSTTPWHVQAGHLENIYGQAQDLSTQGPYEYGPDRVAGFDEASNQAFGMAEERARGGSDVTRSAQDLATRTMSGEFLNRENPGYRRMAEVGGRDLTRQFMSATNSLGSRMEAAGRTGSGAHATGQQVAGENLATGLADYHGNLAYQNYNAERDRQMGMAGMANDLANQDYRDISALRNVGMQREEKAQQFTDDMVARFNQQQYAVAEKLAEYSNFIGQPVMTSQSKGKSSAWNMSVLWG